MINQRFVENVKVLLRQNKAVYILSKFIYIPIAFYLFLDKYSKTRKKSSALAAYLNKLQKNTQKIYYFGVPTHENLGDAAQMYCIRKWINENYPDKELVEVETRPTYTKKIRRILADIIKPDDILINESGATFCNRHEDHRMHRYLLKTFKQNKIIFMPQTVDLTDKGEMGITASLFNEHPYAFFIARDPESFRIVKETFDNNRIMFCPDIVTTLIGNVSFNNKRKGILVCKRIDGEKKYSDANISKLLKDLKNNVSDIVFMTDTNFEQTIEYTYSHLEEVLIDKLSLFSKYEVILTDRYHGMIFSLIANTPVVVLPTTGHKVREGALLFKKDYPESIYFCETLEDSYQTIKNVMVNNICVNNKNVFEQEYYSNLKNIINTKISK